MQKYRVFYMRRIMCVAPTVVDVQPTLLGELAARDDVAALRAAMQQHQHLVPNVAVQRVRDVYAA